MSALDLPKLKSEAAGEIRSELLLKALSFVERASGTALGIAISGDEHLNPDEVLEKLSVDGIALSAEIRAGLHKAQAIHPCAGHSPLRSHPQSDGGFQVKTKSEYVAENRRMKSVLTELVAFYHRGSFINCITPSARRDAKRGSQSARYFKLWDDAKTLSQLGQARAAIAKATS